MERASLLPASAAGPHPPECGPHLVLEAYRGIRSGPAQTIKQGRALQVGAAAQGFGSPLSPPQEAPGTASWEEVPGDAACSFPLAVPSRGCSPTSCPPSSYPRAPRLQGSGRRRRQRPLSRPLSSWREEPDGISRGRLELGCPRADSQTPTGQHFCCCQEAGEGEVGVGVSQL